MNPGSDEAIRQGCTCPKYDNARGKGAWGNPDIFWTNLNCPIHGKVNTVNNSVPEKE